MAIIPKVYGAIKGLGTFTARNEEEFGRLMGAVRNYSHVRGAAGGSMIGNEGAYITNNAKAGAKDDLGTYGMNINKDGKKAITLQTDIGNRLLINMLNADGQGGLDYGRLGAAGAIGAASVFGAATIYDHLSNN